MTEERRRLLFLDLEDTVIYPVPISAGGWFNCELFPANVEKIRRYIAEWQPHSVNLFSFAVWNDDELLKFNQGCRQMVEKAIGRRLDAIPTLEDMIRDCKEVKKINGDVDMQDALQMWGKHEMFRLCMRNRAKGIRSHGGPGIEVTLMDDVVYNEVFSWDDSLISGRLINILQMEPAEHGSTWS